MKNGDKVIKDGIEYTYMNGVYFDDIQFDRAIKNQLKKEIGSVAAIIKILGDGDYKMKKEEMRKRHKKEVDDLEEYNDWREKYFGEMGL